MNSVLYICYGVLQSGRFLLSQRAAMTTSFKKFHEKARCEIYPGSEKKRQAVPNEKVPWTEEYSEYDPPDYTAKVVADGPIWADPDIKKGGASVKFNKRDGLVNRVSFTGVYDIVDKVPRNPCGRTGLQGRGLLGKWGPNHAADPIVTRWKRDKDGNKVKDQDSNLPILQFVAILRADSGEWAIPGGMVDAGERVSLTLKREFGEEALNSLKYSAEDRKSLDHELSVLFQGGLTIHSGYVDDPRNTDNAWMETVAVNFHDEEGISAGKLPLDAGDDAGSVRWMDMSSALKLYANHIEFLAKTAKERKAYW